VVRVTIPQAEGAESLNVAAAGAALLAEAVRQRATGSGSLTGR
jgi:tRNA G18 (ribose-2'-O)-methylase SpoU